MTSQAKFPRRGYLRTPDGCNSSTSQSEDSKGSLASCLQFYPDSQQHEQTRKHKAIGSKQTYRVLHADCCREACGGAQGIGRTTRTTLTGQIWEDLRAPWWTGYWRAGGISSSEDDVASKCTWLSGIYEVGVSVIRSWDLWPAKDLVCISSSLRYPRK